jgi:hypothetical protein
MSQQQTLVGMFFFCAKPSHHNDQKENLVQKVQKMFLGKHS